MELLDNLNNIITNLVNSLGFIGVLLSCLLIVVESIIPVLPLAVFITLNFMTFGNVFGFIISWAFTLVGCSMSFFIFRKGIYKKFRKFADSREKLSKLMAKITDMSLMNIVLLLAIPFTPAFMVNIAAGLSDMSFKKYFCALMIGKISLVYFWGYIGTSLIESFKDPVILIKVGVLVGVMYLISLFVNKKVEL